MLSTVALFAPCKTCDGHPPDLDPERAALCSRCGRYRRTRARETTFMGADRYRAYVKAEKEAGRE